MKHHLIRALALFCLLLLCGCSWFDWMEGEGDAAEAARARRVTAVQDAEAPIMGAPQGETMADRRLRDIFEKQQALYERLGDEGANLADPEYDRMINEVVTEYQSYLLDYPESVHGFILYGKMLRDIGQRKEANNAFIRANRLDGNLAVVKQQIGNFLAEEGEASLALAYYISAAELAPNEPIYAYQVGEVLYTFHDKLIAEGAIDAATAEAQMQEAFARAHQLDPSNRKLTQRYAESFYDVTAPDWNRALLLWRALEGSARDPVERDWARLQEARVLLKLGRREEARATLDAITQPGLREARDTLLQEAST